MLPTGSKSIGIQVAGNTLGNLPTRLDSSIFIGINKTSRGTLSRSIYIGLNPPANENDYMSIGDSYGIQRFLQGHASYGQAYLFPDQPNKIFLGWSLALHTNVSNLPTNVMVLGNRQITDWLLGSHSDAGPGVTQLRASSKRIDNPNTGYTPATQYFRIIGPSSVGTGVGGSFRLAVTPAGASGSTLNAAFDAITIYGADGNVGISNVTSPTAKLHIAAGTATASTAPLKLTSGTNLTTPESGAVEYDGTEFYGTTSTASRTIFARVLKGSATLDFGSTAAGAVTDLTITVTGAADGDVVSLSVPNASQTTTGSFSAWVSATNTVTVRYRIAALTGSEDPASGIFKVSVTK